MKQEVWIDIKDCNIYEVSSNGNLRHKHDNSAVQEWSFRGYRMATLTTNIGIENHRPCKGCKSYGDDELAPIN